MTSLQTTHYPTQAYLSVTTRSNVPPSESHLDTNKRVVWPEGVREYVRSNFAQENWIQLGISRDAFEARLKAVISDAQKNDELLTTDWKAVPSVYQFILNERNESNRYLKGTGSTRKRNSDDAFASVDKSDRKEFGQRNLATTAPWRKSEAVPMSRLASLQDRIKQSKSEDRAEKRQKKNHKTNKTSQEDSRTQSALPRRSPSPVESPGPVVGRSQQLERRYLRLTAAPDPEMVRPLPILKETLQLLKGKWMQDNDYSYICEQFKSLRQDLTVQHIKNDFTTNVYEVHARIALEKGDLGEFNQCQTQLKALYALGLGGKPTEFKAYRILYAIHTNNMMNMNDILASISPSEKTDVAIEHALNVRAARASGNYHSFFQLYQNAPNMNAYLMDMFVARERLSAMAAITKS